MAYVMGSQIMQLRSTPLLLENMGCFQVRKFYLNENQEVILNAVKNDSSINTRRIANTYLITQSSAWRILHINYCLNLFQLQRVQQLKMQFCNWINEDRRLYRYVLLTDKAQVTRDGINILHNEHRWSYENPNAIVEYNFQHKFSINVCSMIVNLSIHNNRRSSYRTKIGI